MSIQWREQVRAWAVFVVAQVVWSVTEPDAPARIVESIEEGHGEPEGAPVFERCEAADRLWGALRFLGDNRNPSLIRIFGGNAAFVAHGFRRSTVRPAQVWMNAAAISPLDITIEIDGERVRDPEALRRLMRQITADAGWSGPEC
jgi:hypothetical protein